MELKKVNKYKKNKTLKFLATRRSSFFHTPIYAAMWEREASKKKLDSGSIKFIAFSDWFYFNYVFFTAVVFAGIICKQYFSDFWVYFNGSSANSFGRYFWSLIGIQNHFFSRVSLKHVGQALDRI